MSLPSSAAALEPPGAVDAALERLKRLHPKKIDLSLDRVYRLLAALGDPHTRLPPVVHVAGTNGKGSTLAFLRAFLEAAGYRVHVYTSPHLVRFNERIRLAGRPIGDGALADVLTRCEAANGDAPITYFEVTTCAAFLAFAEVPADVVLLETGLGGRLDATNVIDRPAATAVTAVSFDHMQFLGDTIASIAGEKAGILKPGVPAVLGPQVHADTAAVVRARAAAVGAPLLAHGRDWAFRADGDGFQVTWAVDPDRGPPPRLPLRMLPLPALPGPHQLANAATAVVLAGLLPGPPVPESALVEGLAGVEWPGRLQRLTHGPLARQLPQGWDLWLDGGHNEDAAVALAAWAAGLPPRPLYLIAGMIESKRPEPFFRALAGTAAAVRTVPVPGESAALDPEAMAAAARAAGIADVRPAADAGAALADLAARPGAARVLIAGSLYLAGLVLAGNG